MSLVPQRELPLFDPPAPFLTDIYRKRLALMQAANTEYRSDFREWLDANWHVWQAFEREANRIWERGRRHYSARTIGEYLRHESALRQLQDESPWKLNDHAWPDLARLYIAMYPLRAEFFELRRPQSRGGNDVRTRD